MARSVVAAPWSTFRRAVAGIVFVASCALSAMIDPSDFLLGSLHRPRLEILHPSNGQVLDNGDLRIEIKVAGYDMPSNLHSSKICIGISTGLDFATEQCFQQTDVVFHANGLAAGTQYALRVVLLERGQALAVSVRHFRVGGIRGVPALAEVLTIKTAVQVAVQYHNSGLDTEAETIYRQILAENPHYPDALHLLGMVFYQRGDLLSAAEYVERALLNSGSNSVQSYHSTLGACYKRLGRLEEAEEQFRNVLLLSPYDPVAMFNLGLVLQEQGQHQWMQAVTLYRNATLLSQREVPPGAVPSTGQSVLSDEAREQAKVRECDILYALRRYQEGLDCWQQASTLFPRSSVVFNELGGVLASMGEMERAIAAYRAAFSLGKHSAQVNIALLLEQLGLDNEARAALDEAITWARSQGLPVYHLLIRKATVIVRIMPAEVGAIEKLRSDHLRALEQVVASSEREVDNGSPVHMTYSLGYHYLFHGASDDRDLKQRLARVYLSLCPALSQGVFLESTASLQSLLPASSPHTNTGAAADAVVAMSASATLAEEYAIPLEQSAKLRLGFVSRFFCYHSVGLLVGGLVETLHAALQDEVEVHLVVVEGGAGSVYHDSLQQYILRTTPFIHYLPNPTDLTGSIDFVRKLHLDVLVFPEQSLDPLTYFMSFARSAPVQAMMLVHPCTSGVPSVDYFLTSEEVQGLEAQNQYSETLVPLPGLTSRLLDLHRSHAVTAYYRTDAVASVRSEVLVELGLPANAHLYVVPHSPVRIHPSFDAALVKILAHDKLATIVFCDPAVPRISWQQQLLSRILNTSADSISAGTTSGSSTSSSASRSQLVFANISSTADMLKMYQASSVVLEPFPATGSFLPSLDALSLGVPVVTLPLKHLGGRLTLALYRLMGYGEKTTTELATALHPPDLPPPDGAEDPSVWLAARVQATTQYNPLVVSSWTEFVSVAMKIAHQPALRDYHSHQLLWRRHKLFRAPPQLVSRWKTFLFEARANHSSSQLATL